MPTVTSADGTRIEHDRTGAGPTVIIIGAGPNDRNANAELAGLLATRCTVINYDRRGRGGSGDTQPYSPDREIEDLRAVADAAGAPVSLFGTSGGAFIAFRAVAAGMPVERIAVWEPPYPSSVSGPAVPPDYLQQQKALADRGHGGDMVELFLTAAVGLPAEVVAGMRQAPFWAVLEAAANPALVYDAEIAGDFAIPVDQLARLDCPVLVLDGGTTPWLTRCSDAVAEALPKADRKTLAGQQHNVEATALTPALADYFTR